MLNIFVFFCPVALRGNAHRGRLLQCKWLIRLLQCKAIPYNPCDIPLWHTSVTCHKGFLKKQVLITPVTYLCDMPLWHDVTKAKNISQSLCDMSTKHEGFGKAFVTYFVAYKNINLIKILLSHQNNFVNANLLISFSLRDISEMKIFVYLRLVLFVLLIFSEKCMTMNVD